MTAEEARAAAAMIRIDGLVLRAQDYLSRYEKDLRSEGGGVPVELAAVLGVLNSGRPGFFWYVAPPVQARLEVGKGGSPALQLWAGLRVVNEAALKLAQLGHTVGLPPDVAAPDYWAAVLRLEALGPRAFTELCSAAGGCTFLAHYVAETDPGVVQGLPAGTVVYRVLAVQTWVLAALELCAARGTQLELRPGELVPSRDARVQRIAKRATLGGWLLANAAALIRSKGLIPDM